MHYDSDFVVRHNSDFSAEHLCVAIIDVYSCLHPTPHSRGGHQLLNNPRFKCVQLGTTPNSRATFAAESVTLLFVPLQTIADLNGRFIICP